MKASHASMDWTATRITYVEPFDGGSHAMFTRTLTSALNAKWTSVLLPGRHWKWRMRGSAVHAALSSRNAFDDCDLLVASSFVPLAELVGLIPTLASVPRVLFFHENQFAYPTEGAPDPRDLHFGVTQMVSGLAADACVFNSVHNRDTFLEAADRFLARMPDAVPVGWVSRLRQRSRVLPLPLPWRDVPPECPEPTASECASGPLVLWNHRWEHDKRPDVFLDTMVMLAAEGRAFRVAMVGQNHGRISASIRERVAALGDRVEHLGFVASRRAYEDLLRRSQVVVSTADHEFFGVSVLEATHFGARPLVPDRLAYPEAFPARYRFGDRDALLGTLRAWIDDYCRGHDGLRGDRRDLTRPFLVDRVIPRYRALFADLLRRDDLSYRAALR